MIEVLLLLLTASRRTCPQCGATFWCPHSALDGELAVGKERYICLCGARYETGNREWVHLTRVEQRKYFWSGTLAIPVITTALGAVGGYLLRWHEPYWFMAVFIGFLGLISGMICSSFLWLRRGLRIWASVRRTRDLGTPDLVMQNFNGAKS
jgi:hypothetical protein